MKNDMNIGELRDKIEIQEYVEVINEYGASEMTYNTIAIPRAKTKYISSKERISNGSQEFSYSIKFIIRYRKGISSEDHYILFDNIRYNITNVYPLENRKFMELSCERVK